MAAGDFSEGVESQMKVFDKEITGKIVVETVDDAEQVGMGTFESFVMAYIGNDDVVFGGLGNGIGELLSEDVEADAEFGGDGGRGVDGRAITNGAWVVKIGLVANVYDGLVIANGDVGVGNTRLSNHYDDTGTLSSGNRSVYAHQLNLVFCVADACGVNEAEGDAIELNGVFDGIAGSALYVTDDGALFAEESIEEG